MKSYNGYSSEERKEILREYHRRKKSEGFRFEGAPCGMCGDPDTPPDSWHSEDYSRPFVFSPPATYPICKTCHGRIHKRFNQPNEWRLFLEHLKRGGYGSEFTKWYSLGQRKSWTARIAEGDLVELPRGRPRQIDGSEWWLGLTLDSESLEAAWARPRPFRPRPTPEQYAAAMAALRPTSLQMSLLNFHASRPRRTVAMRDVANGLLASDKPTDANLQYGGLARRICEHTRFEPDRREDGTEIWMSAIAEGWQPEGREYEWVMVPSLVAVLPE